MTELVLRLICCGCDGSPDHEETRLLSSAALMALMRHPIYDPLRSSLKFSFVHTARLLKCISLARQNRFNPV